MPREPHVYQEEAPKLQLERLARKRIKRQKELTQSMEIPPKDLYDIYDRLNRQYARAVSQVGLDAFWQAVVGSLYSKQWWMRQCASMDLIIG